MEHEEQDKEDAKLYLRLYVFVSGLIVTVGSWVLVDRGWGVEWGRGAEVVICILGAGVVGLFCAYQLRAQNDHD